MEEKEKMSEQKVSQVTPRALTRPELLQELQAEYGASVYRGSKNQFKGINQQYFAALFAALHMPKYEMTERCFYLYNLSNGAWEKVDESDLMNLISLMLKEYAAITEDTDINTKRDAGTIRRILSFLASLCKGNNLFDHSKQDPFIHCANGMVCFEFKKDAEGHIQDVVPILKPFSPDFYSRNYTDIDFIPGDECNEFLNHLLVPAMSEDDSNYLQYYAGQSLLGVNYSQTFLILTGTAGGGKSTLVNIIENLVTRQNCTELRLEHMNSRFETQRLVGKTLLTAKDVPSNFLSTAGAHKLKALTGKDTMTIEHKGCNDAPDVRCAFNAIITANNTLRVTIDGDREAWRRRIIWVRYDRPAPEKRITDFDEYLLAQEGRGILAWAIEGACKLLKNDKKIPRSPEQESRIDNLLQESNSLLDFVCTCIVPDDHTTITTAEMVEAFHTYGKKQHWECLSQTYIEHNLPEYMFRIHGVSKRTDIKRDGHNNRGYKGFSIAL